MQKVFAVMWTDLRIFLSDRANLVGLLLIPSVLTIVLGLAQTGGGTPTIDVAILDNDQSSQSEIFFNEVAGINENFDVTAFEGEEDNLRQRIVNGEFDAAVIIPAGFGAAIENFEPIDLSFYSNEDATSPSALEPSIQAIVGRFNGSIIAARVGANVAENLGVDIESDDIYDRANAILAQNPVVFDYQLTEVDDADSSGTGFNQSVPGMGSMFVLFTILGGMQALIRERENWTLQRLIVMPVSRGEVIGGKILAYFILGLLQYIVVFAIGIAFGMNLGNSILGLVLIAMAFSLAATALTFAVATRLRTQGQASQLTTMLALSLAALGGAWWPLEIVPDFMKVVGHFSPIAWAMDGFQDLIFFGGGLVDILPEVAILLAISAGLFAIGVMGFKYE